MNIIQKIKAMYQYALKENLASVPKKTLSRENIYALRGYFMTHVYDNVPIGDLLK